MADAGIVDENVQPAKILFDSDSQIVDRNVVGNIHRLSVKSYTLRFELGGHFFQGRPVDIRQNKGRTGIRKQLGHFVANAGGRAGDEHRLVLKFSHCVLLALRSFSEGGPSVCF